MNLQIFRLRSGEELICQVIEETRTKFKISNPFIFKSSTMTDKNGPYDMIILRDWLAQTNDKIASIPKNHIVLQYEPKEDTKKLYTLQLNSEKDLHQEIVTSESERIKNDILDQEQLFHDFLNSLVQDANQSQSDFANWNTPENKPLKGKRKKQKQPSVEFSPGELDRHGIYVTMMIPSEAIMNLISANILDPEDLLKMIKEVKRKNRFTGDEKNRSDFGNKMSDWNPDPGSDEYK